MNMKKIKRFFTFVRRKDGFTLVELIVVIAILAILGGVAVPAYSGYVKKANIGADQALVSEIAHAVELYNYSTGFASSVANDGIVGYVAITQDKIVAADGLTDASGVRLTNLDEAMKKAFGESYADSVRLKYDGWTDTATMLNQAKNNQYAGSVNESTYINKIGTEQLLGDVQNCTTSLVGLLGNVDGDLTFTQSLLAGEFDAGVFDSKLKVDEITTDTLANATVFAVADKVKSNSATIVSDFSEEGYLEQTLKASNNVVDTANWYAALEAMVNELDDPAINAEFEALNANIASAASGSDSRGAVINEMKESQSAILDLIYEDESEGGLLERYQAYYQTPEGGKSQAQLDAESYVGVMKTVNDVEDDYISDKTYMNNNALFGGGILNERIDSFIAAFSLAELMNDPILSEIASESGSSVVVIFTVEDGVLQCISCPVGANAGK